MQFSQTDGSGVASVEQSLGLGEAECALRTVSSDGSGEALITPGYNSSGARYLSRVASFPGAQNDDGHTNRKHARIGSAAPLRVMSARV